MSYYCLPWCLSDAFICEFVLIWMLHPLSAGIERMACVPKSDGFCLCATLCVFSETVLLAYLQREHCNNNYMQ